MTSLTIKLWKKHVANRFLISQNQSIIGYRSNLKKVLVCECVWVCVCVYCVYGKITPPHQTVEIWLYLNLHSWIFTVAQNDYE